MTPVASFFCRCAAPARYRLMAIHPVAIAIYEGRPPAPRRIAPGRLHLDHIGPHVGQNLGGAGPGQVLRKIDDPHTGQRSDRGPALAGIGVILLQLIETGSEWSSE